MTDAFTAAADLLRAVPLRIRQTVYGLLGLIVVFDAALSLLPDQLGDALVVVFGIVASLLSLANSKPPPPVEVVVPVVVAPPEFP